MANTDIRRRPFKVCIGVDENGIHSVFSESEPVFCFLRKTEAEALAVAQETVRDYLARFGRPPAEPAMLRNVTVHKFKQSREVELEVA